MSTGSIRLVYDHACERWLMCEGPADCGSVVSGQVDRCTRKLAEQVRGKASRQHFFFGFLPWPESGIWNKPFFPPDFGGYCLSQQKKANWNKQVFKGWDTMSENKHFNRPCSSHGVFHIWACAHLSSNTWLKQKDVPCIFCMSLPACFQVRK